MAESNQDKTPPEKRPEGAGPDGAPATKHMPGMYARERVLIACVVLLIALLGFTAFIVRQYKHTVHRYADEWSAKGEAALKAGQTDAATNDYRNALVYKPNDPTFQFQLAEALARAGKSSQARAYLLNLLSENPGSGPINLTLARVAVREGNVSDAVRYYHNAIYGVWDTDPLTRRWEVRRELCQYLLNEGDVHEAEPDLIALAQDVPPRDVARAKIAGGLLLRGGLWSRALILFRGMLSTDRHDPDVLAGAGRAAFEMGQYPQAADYLQRLPREKRESPQISRMLRTSGQAIALDPFRPGLSASEQARRTAKALTVAKARIAACARQRGESLTAKPPASELQKLNATAQQNRVSWSVYNLSHHPDRVSAAMAFAFEAEATATKLCGYPTSSADRALSLIEAGRTRQPNE